MPVLALESVGQFSGGFFFIGRDPGIGRFATALAAWETRP
jgi:hypothetical protein